MPKHKPGSPGVDSDIVTGIIRVRPCMPGRDSVGRASDRVPAPASRHLKLEREGGAKHASVRQPAAPGHLDLPKASAATAMSADACADMNIGGHSCKVIRVDNVLPQHNASHNAGRPRFVYAAGEIAHFELGGHRYALVAEEPYAYDPGGSGTKEREPTASSRDIRELLTNRELQIVQLVSMGCLARQAADRLGLSEFTVRSYLKTIYCKLGVRSRGAMVYRYAQAFKDHEVDG